MFGKEKKRPASADGERPTSSKFVRPCSAGGSSRSSRPASADDSDSAKSSRPGSPKKRPKKPRAFSADSSPKTSRDGSPKSSSSLGSTFAGASPKSSRQDSPAGSPKSSRSSKLSTFRRWGSPFAPTSKNSTRPCSADLTIVSLQDSGCAFSQKTQTKIPRERSSPETLKFAGGSNPATKRLMQVTMCAANARAPILESKARKLALYKNTDKESLIDELQSLKGAVADQAYHFQLHKSHLHGLRAEHHELEEKLAAIESIDGSNAPRTGSQGRLLSKIAGMRMRISTLEDDITNQQETIHNLKYRYQVCLTQEASIQRDMAAGDVWRLQKEVRNARGVLKSSTKHNRKFLHLRDQILPELRESLIKKQEKIKEAKLIIKEVEKLSKQSTDESYAHLRAADKAQRRASSLHDEGKKMRAKLKRERESKRKTQQDVWVIGYETCMLVKENRRIDRLNKVREAAMAAKVARARVQEEEKGRKKRW